MASHCPTITIFNRTPKHLDRIRRLVLAVDLAIFNNPVAYLYIDGREAYFTKLLELWGVDLTRCKAVNYESFLPGILKKSQYLTSTIESALSETDGIINDQSTPGNHKMGFIWLDYCATWKGSKTAKKFDNHTRSHMKTSPEQAFNDAVRFYSDTDTRIAVTLCLRGNPTSTGDHAQRVADIKKEMREILTRHRFTTARIEYYSYTSLSATIPVGRNGFNPHSIRIKKNRDSWLEASNKKGNKMYMFYMTLKRM